MKTRMTTLTVLILVFVAYAGSISKEFNREYNFRGEKVSLDNVNGKIVIEAWQKNKVEIKADIKVRASDKREAERYMEKIEIVVRKNNNRMDIRVDRPDSQGGHFLDWVFGPGKPNCTVDFWIKIPYDTDIEATSVNGSIEALDIRGRSKFSTTNGRIAAENMQGPVDAGTTNGSILVDIREKRLLDNMDIHTVNGSIKLRLADDVDANISISTVNGSINSDFPLQIEGKWGPKNANGELGRGGKNIELSTVNGSVSLEEN